MARKRLTKKQGEISTKILYLEQDRLGLEMQIKRIEGKIEAYKEMFVEESKAEGDSVADDIDNGD